MRAAVTEGRETMRIVDVPDPGEPGAGEVLVRPEAVGICGSDFHYFLGDIGAVEDSQLYPRIQGHEASGVIEALGPGVDDGLSPGQRVALWPLSTCGQCYPCRLGRHNVCSNISLIGIHRDGALQERLRVPASQVFPIGDQDPAVAALIEPVSIAVRAVVRGRVAEGERAVVFGAGPIGQAVSAAAIDRGASVLLLDPLPARLEHGKAMGAEVLLAEDPDESLRRAREWAGGDGPEVVFEATGDSEVARRAVELVAQAGRVVVVGLSRNEAPLRAGDLAFKEIDMLGVSCCNPHEFAEAVSLVDRMRGSMSGLVTHQFPLDQAPDAIVYAMRNPAEVMKAVIRIE